MANEYSDPNEDTSRIPPLGAPYSVVMLVAVSLASIGRLRIVSSEPLNSIA